MKFTRDWEYPWVLLRGEAAPGKRMLDCGSGYSPLPFLWAKRGASVTALDRDAIVAGPIGYLAWCAREAAADLFGRRKSAASPSAASPLATTRRPAEQTSGVVAESRRIASAVVAAVSTDLAPFSSSVVSASIAMIS